MGRFTDEQIDTLSAALQFLNPNRSYPADICAKCGHCRLDHIPEAGGCVGGIHADCMCHSFRAGLELHIGSGPAAAISSIIAGHHATDPNWRPPEPPNPEEQP